MKTVVVSSNSNANYLYFAKYIEKAWNTLGWDVLFMVSSEVNIEDLHIKNSQVVRLPRIPEARTETIAQAGRLYAANHIKEGLIMTSDIDLLPLKDYWNPQERGITVYGYDLTGRTEYPIGYIAMSKEQWIEKFQLTGDTEHDMKRDITTITTALSKDWNLWWGYDQELVMHRLSPFHKGITFIDRGFTERGLALGRIDRFDWNGTQDQDWIDAHCDAGQSVIVLRSDFLKVYKKVYDLPY